MNAVIGDGSTVGCSDDVDGINYVQQWPAPGPGDPVPPVNISGQGATFILGENARIVVDNTNGSTGPFNVTFNRRYVDPLEEAALPTAGVSIMSVNGDDEADDGPSGVSADLDVPNVIGVPFSVVSGVTPEEPAHDGGYTANIHNPKPEPPAPPINVSGVAHDGAVVITWQAPPISTLGRPPDRHLPRRGQQRRRL